MASDGRSDFDPKEIARATFPTAFRGYDTEAVRRYLTRLAASVGRAQEDGLLGAVDQGYDPAHIRAAEAEHEAATMRARVSELEDRLRAQAAQLEEATRAAEAARSASSPPSGAPPARELDEAELIGLLGQETARIVEAARNAAADITHRADEEASLIRAEATLEARAAREEAEERTASARVEADQIVAAASADATRSQARIKAELTRSREHARVKAEEMMAEASSRAESDLAAARQRANQIVVDAETLRDEILGDLVRRRRLTQEQLDRLMGARDRLARVLSAARGELDQVATDLDGAVDTGVDIDLTEDEQRSEHLDDEVASTGTEPNEVAELVSQLQGANDSWSSSNVGDGPPVANGSAAPPNGSTALLEPGVGTTRYNGSASSGVDTGRVPPPAPVHERGGNGNGNGAANGHGTGNGYGHAHAEHGGPFDADDLLDDEFSDGPTNGLGGPERLGDGDLFELDTADVASDYDGDYDDPIDGDELDRVAADSAGMDTIDPETGEVIIDLTGPAYPDPVLGTGPGAMRRTATRGDLPRNTPFAGSLPAPFEGRDIALNRSTAGFRRRLKRAVNDDQSDVLDRLRAGRGAIGTDELPELEAQLTSYIAALRPALNDVVAAGGELLGSADVPTPAVDNLCLQLAKHIVENLRSPTVEAIETSPDDDREAILDPVRAIYRDFRNAMLPDLIEDALHEAYALGLYYAIGPGSAVLWLTDPRLDPDPICEENSASPPLPKGTEFPSGHARPLSMPGCRCLAVPARG